MNHTLRIIGSAELPEPLEYKDYLISINATVTDINKKSDEAGSYTFTYKAKQRTCEILKDNGEIIKTKDKSKISKQMRDRIWILNQEYGLGEDEMVYEKLGKAIIANMDSIARMLKIIP